jgi:GNAT superfamily N-acetyltransferase
MILRAATLGDAGALSVLAREAFVAAFGPLYRPEDLDAFLAEHRSRDAYAAQIADPAVRVMLAEHSYGALSAYCLIKLGAQFDEHPTPRPVRPVMLSQLYCAATTTGQGTGAMLMAWVLEEARAYGADAITLSVYCENFGAQRFYQRFGFAKVADIHFHVGQQRDEEFLYQLTL